MASQVAAEQFLSIRAEFFSFCFQEADDDFVPVPYPEDFEADSSFLTAHEGRIDVVSAGHTHVASLTVQVWDAEPPPEADGAWDISGDSEIFSATGELSLWAFGGPVADSVELGEPGRRWKVRLSCSGREEVAQRAQLEVPHGVERYLAQFWPVDA
ncbi:MULTISPECIES: hypothetical protein [Streptomyces]|uniref:Uncharacterized protein n=1 Tax=Streptomyces ramulosus TaxID=47762 RepID=A0ABW1FSI5_9ACTN